MASVGDESGQQAHLLRIRTGLKRDSPEDCGLSAMSSASREGISPKIQQPWPNAWLEKQPFPASGQSFCPSPAVASCHLFVAASHASHFELLACLTLLRSTLLRLLCCIFLKCHLCHSTKCHLCCLLPFAILAEELES